MKVRTSGRVGAVTINAKYGRITYSGVVEDDTLGATFIWFDKDKYWKPEQVKWWKGSLKK